MKLSSTNRLGSLIMPIFFIFFYDHPSTSGSNSGNGRKTLVCASSKYKGSPCVSTSTDRRMRQYRSPDVPVQIAGCPISGPEMLPEALWLSQKKMKNIGIISESNLNDDENFIFYSTLPLTTAEYFQKYNVYLQSSHFLA